MKIILAQSSLNTLGGAELAIRDQAESLNLLGHHPVLLSSNKELIREVSEYSWLKFKKMPNLPKILSPIAWIHYLLVVIKHKPDLINTHSQREHIGFVLTKAFHRTPVVWQDPGDLIHYIKPNRKNPLGLLNQKILEWAALRADCICVLNKEDLNILSRRSKNFRLLAAQSRIKVIETNILFRNYRTDNIVQNNSHKLVVAFIGRLDEIKGPQYLIESLQFIKTSSALEIWIIGDGPIKTKLEQSAKKIQYPIRFFGSQSDVSPYLSRADIVVQPSQFEGWGRTVKEAMYFGKPIIGSNVGGIAAQICDGKTGLLFEPKNIDELSNKLSALINNKTLRKTLGIAAREKAIADGDYLDLLKYKILPLFESVVAKAP